MARRPNIHQKSNKRVSKNKALQNFVTIFQFHGLKYQKAILIFNYRLKNKFFFLCRFGAREKKEKTRPHQTEFYFSYSNLKEINNDLLK